MSIPVLLYAAQVKQLTQKRIVRTGHAILTLPSDVADYAVEMMQEAHRMIISMQEQVRTIRRRQRARRQQKTRQLPRMKQQQTESVDEPESVSPVSPTMDVDMDSSPRDSIDDSICSATAPAPRLGDGEIKDAKKLETLTEQIKLLKEQMELFAKAKQNAGSPATVRPSSASSAPAPVSVPPAPLSPIPAAPSMAVAANIPIAPPLDVDIPLAPPLDDATTITIQNPFTPFTPVRLVNTISQSSSSTNHTPSPISMEQLSSPDTTSSVETSSPATSELSEDSCSPDQENESPQAPNMQPSQQRLPLRNVTNQAPNRTMQAPLLKSKTLPSSPGLNPIKLRPPQPTLKRVFTRRIPGADVLSHNDLIKVSAKIKLRKTNVPRSPGGTPRKENVSTDPFANALFHKFKNVHGEAASRRSIHPSSSSTSSSFPPNKRHSRISFGKRDDHDDIEEWNTA